MRAVVVGASRGIGMELVRQLAAAGHQVTGTSRGPVAEPPAGVTWLDGVELGTDAGIQALAQGIEGPVDLLIHNAGVLSREGLDDLDVGRIRRQLEINALAPLRAVHALLPTLRRESKVALITSRMGSMSDNTSGGMYGYRMSKAALNMAGVSLAQDLAPKGIPVVLLHPGFVRTEMTGGRGNWGPDAAAAGLLARISELKLQTTGSFWHADGTRLPW